jgi:hypothetical protein
MNEPLKFPRRICIDFDGVIHQNTTPYLNPHTIEDPPVDGAFKAIEEYLQAGYRVAVHSARSYTLEGQNAMMRWFVRHGMRPEVLDHLEFPTHKPGAQLYIDDRGYHFRGIFPSVGYLEDFRPWNK